MELNEKIQALQKEKGLKTAELSRVTNIANSTLADIIKGRTEKVSLQIIKSLAKVLDCTIDYLAYDDITDRYAGEEYTVNRNEFKLIERYRILDDHGKKAVDAILDIERDRCITKLEIAEEPVPYNIISLRRSIQTASAGRGIYLGPEAFEEISVIKNDLTQRATFCVPVQGDSMEPMYCDGDMLLVEKSPEKLKLDEIGIYTLDNEGYVKKTGAGELISLNSDYAPIRMHDSIILNGKVIGVLNKEWVMK